MVLIYQALTKQHLKKLFPASNDFVLNGSGLLKVTDTCNVPIDLSDRLIVKIQLKKMYSIGILIEWQL